MIYNKIILDNCVFIALYNENDIFHNEAILEKYEELEDKALGQIAKEADIGDYTNK